MLHGRGVDFRPAQPGLLHHVFSVADGTENTVGGSDQFAAMLREQGGVVSCHAAFRHARLGFSSHWSVKPWLVRPIAALVRERWFSRAMIAVSSTSSASLSCSRSPATCSSVTVGGVWVMATAYWMTCRSRGV